MQQSCEYRIARNADLSGLRRQQRQREYRFGQLQRYACAVHHRVQDIGLQQLPPVLGEPRKSRVCERDLRHRRAANAVDRPIVLLAKPNLHVRHRARVAVAHCRQLTK